jgi:hypothetical protein
MIVRVSVNFKDTLIYQYISQPYELPDDYEIKAVKSQYFDTYYFPNNFGWNDPVCTDNKDDVLSITHKDISN